MVLNKYRKNVDSLLAKISRPFMNLHPNTLSLISFATASLAGLFYYLNFLLISLGFISFSALMDAVDGKVARMRKIASRRGDFLDHTLDRYSDTFILLGIMFSKYATLWIGILALTGVYMTSYLGTQAQAVGLKRIYGGILGRADRLVILIFLPVIQLLWWGYYFSVTDWVLITFAVLGHITGLQRFISAWRYLS